MSIKSRNWAHDATAGGPARKLVLMTIADFADADGYAFPGVPRMAVITEQSEKTVRRCLADLEKTGMLTREARYRDNGGRTTDGYQLAVPWAPPRTDCPVPPRTECPDPPDTVGGTPRTESTPPPRTPEGGGIEEPSVELSVEPSVEEDRTTSDLVLEAEAVLVPGFAAKAEAFGAWVAPQVTAEDLHALNGPLVSSLETWTAGMWGLYGPEGTEEHLRKKAGASWCRVVTTALLRFRQEGDVYNGRRFRRFITSALEEVESDRTLDGTGPRLSSVAEQDRDRAKRNSTNAGDSALVERLNVEAELARVGLEQWHDGAPKKVRDRIKHALKGKEKGRGYDMLRTRLIQEERERG